MIVATNVTSAFFVRLQSLCCIWLLSVAKFRFASANMPPKKRAAEAEDAEPQKRLRAPGTPAGLGQEGVGAPNSPLPQLEPQPGIKVEKAQLSGMLGHLKYHAKKGDADCINGLEFYKTLANNQKSAFFLKFSKDKSCKWCKEYTHKVTTQNAKSSGSIKGEMNGYPLLCFVFVFRLISLNIDCIYVFSLIRRFRTSGTRLEIFFAFHRPCRIMRLS